MNLLTYEMMVDSTHGIPINFEVVFKRCFKSRKINHQQEIL